MAKTLIRLVMLSILALGATSCAEDPDDTLSAGNGTTIITAADGSTLVIGSVNEWDVVVNQTTVSAGNTTFLISNKGTIPHEFLVVKTNFEDGKIPIDPATNRFSEEGEGLEVVDEISEWKSGTTESLTLSLEAGKYQLLCNIEAHYANGMHVAFTVQ
jgi:uncharacterized cupredoxin-like copper-binding protein